MQYITLTEAGVIKSKIGTGKLEGRIIVDVIVSNYAGKNEDGSIKNDAEFYSVILPDNVKKEIKAGSRLHIVGNLKTEFNKFKLTKEQKEDKNQIIIEENGEKTVVRINKTIYANMFSFLISAKKEQVEDEDKSESIKEKINETQDEKPKTPEIAIQDDEIPF